MTTTYDPSPSGSALDGPPTEPVDRRDAAAAERRGVRWQRISLVALLAGTALLYLVGLSKSDWANQYYAAAAQAGAQSWKAMLFGSLDSANFITVDKPPASLWVMDLAMRFFGVNSWSLLVPQALEGVAAVALLYAAVKRVGGHPAGLLAGAALAVTPVATLMFRFDNPDAMLVLLMTAAAYATVRAVERASWRWLSLCGALLGFAFLTKMLQGLIVVPAFALAYLVAAPVPLGRRIRHTLVAGAALVAAAGWWVALVELWPAGSRPYIGGSRHNSILELTFGYNGFGRLTGSDNNGTPGGNGGGGFSSGQTGLTRLFGTEMGTQISWLLPPALVAILALAWLTWRAPRTDAVRASLIMWGGWLVVTGLVFSYASGIIHPYYTIALAPALAALVGLGVTQLWRRREVPTARLLLATMIAAASGWTWRLLGRADWHPELRWVVLGTGVAAAVAVLAPRARALVVGPLVAATLLAGPAAYSLQTASTAHTGALVTAGPASTAGFGGTGGLGLPGGTGLGRTGSRPSLPNGQRPPALPGGTGGATGPNGATLPGTGSGRATAGGAGGMPGGLGGAGSVSSALVSALKSGAYTWSAATTSANEAASLELASGTSVMSLGGFNGTDPAITLSRFKALAAAGEIHYYIAAGNGFIGSTAADTSTAYQIQTWVTSTFTAKTVGGTTVYDLTSG